MTADSVPPVISKIEIFSNNDSGDQGIAKASDEVTLRITSIEDVQKPNLKINSQSIDHSQIGYNSVANQILLRRFICYRKQMMKALFLIKSITFQTFPTIPVSSA